MKHKIISLSKNPKLQCLTYPFLKLAETILINKIGRDLRAQTIRELRQSLIETTNNNIRAILIYGSTAKGKARPDSDIDMMIILNDTDALPILVSEEEMDCI